MMGDDEQRILALYRQIVLDAIIVLVAIALIVLLLWEAR